MACISEQISRTLRRTLSGYELDLATRWVADGLNSRQGRFIVQKIERSSVRGRIVGNGPFTFRATVRVTVAPDFNRECLADFAFRFKGGHFKGEIKNFRAVEARPALGRVGV